MNRLTKIAFLAAAVATLGVSSAFAAGPPTSTGSQNGSTHSQASSHSGPNASLASKAKAYGSECQNQSKSHVDGQTGNPFSQCVTAMAKLATGATTSPTAACSAMSKKHTAGENGTPFSRCVAAGAKLLKDAQQSS
jgi:hypothetical protein